MSPPQLYKRGLVLINQLILASERSFGSIGQQDLIDVRLAKHHYPASGAQPTSFWHVSAASEAKRNPCRRQRFGVWIKPSSLGVRSASVGQVWMGIVSDFFAACVVVLAAVGQLDTSFGRGCWSFVGVTSIEKSSHG